MRRAIKTLIVTILVVMTASAIALSTTTGQSLALRQAINLFGNGHVAIGTLNGSLFGDGSVDEVRLADAGGSWLTLRGISFSWSPTQLLSGHFSVSHLHVEHVRLERGPASPPTSDQSDSGSGFALPLAIRLGDLVVKEFDILAPVMGEAVRLRIAGNAELNALSRASHARFKINRLDGAKGELSAQLAYSPDTHGLDVRIDGNEPEGGAVSRLLGMPSRPPLTLTVNGSGELNAWRADLSIAAADTPFIAGGIHVNAGSEGHHRVKGQLAGYIDRLVPAVAAELFAGRLNVTVAADVTGLSDGTPRSVSDMRLEMSSDTMRLTATGAVDLVKGYMHGAIAGHAGRQDGQPLTFVDESGRRVSVSGIELQASLPDIKGARQLTAKAGISGIRSEMLSVGDVDLVARAIQPEPHGIRAGTFDDISATVTAGGVAADGPLGDAVGKEASATFSGSYDGRRLTIATLDINGAGANAKLSGTLTDALFQGTARLSFASLSQYAALVDRPLTGVLAVDAKIDADVQKKIVSATVQGHSNGVATGVSALDGLLAAATTYGARIERSANGTVSVRDAEITNPVLSVALNGHHGPSDPALSGRVMLSSLAAIDPRLSGKAQLDLDIGGSGADLASKLLLTGDGVMLDGKAIADPRVSFTGRGPQSQHTGKLALSGRISSESVNGTADVVLSDNGANRIDGLALEIAGAQLAGDLAFAPAALPSGRIKLDAKDLGRLGRAAGMPLKGRIAADLELSRNVENGLARISVTGDDLSYGDIRIEGIRSSGEVTNYLDAPDGSIDLKVARIVKSGSTVGSVAFGAQLKTGAATFKGNGQLQGGAFALAGKAQSAKGHHDIDVESFSYAGNNEIPRIALTSASRLVVRDGGISARAFQLAIGSGSLQLAGSASGKTLDLSVGLKRLPATIAAAFAPELGLAGTIDGNARIEGAPSNPHVSARIAATGMSVREMRDRQLPSIDVTTNVSTANSQAKLAIKATARGGLDLALDGTVGLDKNARLALAGQGKVPLSLANVFLADRAARVGGAAVLSAQITGQVSDPRIDGRIALSNATANDPAAGLDLHAIDADVAFTTERVDVRSLVARSKQGGQMTASGSVLFQPSGGATMDIGVRLSDFKFGNQDPVASELGGNLTVTGPLSALVAKGDVLIKRMDITVPNKLPQSVAALDIRHVNAPKGFQSAARHSSDNHEAAPAGPMVSLSVDVQANDRIFVRGRGVDAQLGGLVKIRGMAHQPVTDGQFSMTRGRLTIIGRQLDFSRGNIVFRGSVEPTLDMVAAANVDNTTVTVTVSGSASDPQITFASTPELPEDEIISLLLFNKQLAGLSPTQLVTLAGEIDKIGGLSSGPGTIDKMKSALGIDVFDISTDKSGNAQATAGSYINDKTYVGVKQGASLGNTRIVIDHNLTKNLKARGEMGTDGDSKLGLGVEWDY